jgi:hypothetical protein
MTASILLDYPMPSFVGIPLKLNVTGLSFDGVGVVAYLYERKRMHFCFLADEDAEMAMESSQTLEHEGKDKGKEPGKGGLLREVQIESENGGKTVLKNVGKVERFVLEQVRRIFEEELVFPSYWSFLI